MSGRERELVAAFASELPRGTGLPTTLCGSRAAWTQGPPALSGSADLIVTGSCAALLPGVPVGSLVLPARLRSHAGDELAPDAGLREALARAAEAAGRPVEVAGLAEVESVIDEPSGRESLAERTGCRFADMESASLASAAEAAGRPWVVLRFVSDGPERPLVWLAELYGGFPATEPGIARTLAALARRPRHVGRLLALGRTVAKGRRAVAELLRALPP